jgi:NADP-dependent 3-hydroxy acid dehydrogenase YdfG
MTRPVCTIIGVGPGNGAAFTRRFAAEGYAVAVIARNGEYLSSLCREVQAARPYVWDVEDRAGAATVFADVHRDLGPTDVLIYNAGAGAFGNIDKIDADALEAAFRVNTVGCFLAVEQVLPGMRARGSGNIAVIGATASVRGGANFAAFAAAKAAQRSLAQSMARHLGPQGIHVSYYIIDGVIDLPRTRELLPEKPDEFFLQPHDIAEAVYRVVTQPRSAWTFELDLRPFGEKW